MDKMFSSSNQSALTDKFNELLEACKIPPVHVEAFIEVHLSVSDDGYASISIQHVSPEYVEQFAKLAALIGMESEGGGRFRISGIVDYVVGAIENCKIPLAPDSKVELTDLKQPKLSNRGLAAAG